jgi:hypothetical protein
MVTPTGVEERLGGPYSYRPCGYQQITSLSASVGLTPPNGATVALIAVSVAPIRYRDDGIAPTATVGMPIGIGQTFQYMSDLDDIRFIQQSAGGVLDILYYL